MAATRTVAALATYAALQEWRILIAVLCSGFRQNPAGVALEARRFNCSREIGGRLALKSGRRAPNAFLRVKGDRCLVKEPISREKNTEPLAARSDAPCQRSPPMCSWFLSLKT